jgi:hypothetical protein
MKDYKAFVIWRDENGEEVNPTMELLDSEERLYVRFYNKAVSLLNPCYEAWNRTFEQAHPDQNEAGWQEEYDGTIMEKANRVLERMMRKDEEAHGNKIKVRMMIFPGEDSPELVGTVKANGKTYLCSIRIKKD